MAASPPAYADLQQIPPQPRQTVLREYSSFGEEEELSLHNNTPKERKKWDQLAEFFAIIKTVEHLENARIKNAIGRDEYTSRCSDLIAQFKDAESTLVSEGHITNTSAFIVEFQMDVPYAMERLVKYGVPATVLHRNHDEHDAISRARQAAETTQCFITAMDALKLDQRAVDEVQPLISDVMDRLNKCEGLPEGFEGVKTMRAWLITFNGLRASDQLDDEQVRQLLHDLDVSYSAFFRFLGDSKRGS
ncbi:VPS28 protein-domain-containing protein [Tribonema minus]|uniref:Vacuolar protein sorting-associated protein 28 homolog n=1 Tax=Tribonema minus TaxID=303371 RepID=A0A836CDG2_9STRA|nr:VPS28 protein-domain-containing protein [Tribonema minus]